MTVDQKYRQMQYILANARSDSGIKIKDLLQTIGVGEDAFRTVAYGNRGRNILTVMKVAEGLGYELVLRRRE